MLKLGLAQFGRASGLQPPSGGCVLKPSRYTKHYILVVQPPSGGCVLKLAIRIASFKVGEQPPSGGCVLKLLKKCFHKDKLNRSRLRAAVC